MATMTAYRMIGWGQPPRLVEVPVPEPGPGEVLVKMAGAGLCGTDLHFVHAPQGAFAYELPFTLGHENGGWVADVGAGVSGLSPGDPVLAAGVHSCGRCPVCLRGQDNYCPRGATGRGYGEDGGLAAYMVAPERELVRLHALDPRTAGPLTDAGSTPYHAVKRVLPRLVPGSTAVVIGAGGLGGYAIQYLRLLSPARVIAVDVAPHRLAFARELGAHETVASDESTVEVIRDMTGGAGAEAVFDFFGSDATMRMALGTVGVLGAAALVGAGGGTVPVGWGLVPVGAEIFIPLGARIADLHEVVALAEDGRVRVEVETYPFDQVDAAFARFASGELNGRVVVTLDD